ncbi:MAG: hypothetical protein C0480_22830 [Bradyrhizobium sp.]|jgi:hypothetical protein|nr:hypothetical protein [Bradyrhizobium sp.]
MRKSLPAVIVIFAGLFPASATFAEQPRVPKSDKAATSGKLLPLKGARSANSCAEYGAGFVRIEGTNTCMKIGGAISIGAGVSR